MRAPIRCLLALALLVLTVAPVLSQVRDARAPTREPGAPLPAQAAPDYRLQPGDLIRVRVYGHDDLTGDYGLDAAGVIAFPLLGPVRLDGRTLREAERVLVGALRPDYLRDPHVGVHILNPRPVYVLGEVENPGSYPYRAGLTVTEAVALAGGFTFRADEGDIRISRGRDAARRAQRAAAGTQVLPGDTVTVDSRLF
jgi:polysaccharide export outer membrane protein